MLKLMKNLMMATWFLGMAGWVGWVSPASAQVTIEIINDSGQADTNVFIKVPGKLWPGITNSPITPTNLFADIDNNTPTNPTSIPLSTLPTSGQVVSPISGMTNTVYQFTADYVTSGSIYFTYGQPFTFTNALQPSPPPDSFGNVYRYDYAELSINDDAAANNAMDITYVDKFGIPLQMEWFRGTDLIAGSYVYASTKTLVDRFTTNGLGQAVFALGATDITPGWQYSGPDSYTNFARILAPQKVSGTTSSVAPYPSVTNYLNSLVGSAHAFALNGDSPQSGYYYVGYQVSLDTNASGWVVTLTQTTNTPSFNPADIYGVQYTSTITFGIGRTNASQFVYGAPVGVNFYSVNGVLVTDTNSPSYPVEVWMIGDVLSALNFGFWGGVYGANSEDWFSKVQYSAFPFGSARNPNDGFYNPYAALVYNAADPYTFAFSERITPDVLIAPTNGDRVRITILPDDRLDSPVVLTPSGNAIKRNAITLNWSPVAGATGYQVNVFATIGIASTNLHASVLSYTFTNLLSGTPYSFSVKATGMAHGNTNTIITPRPSGFRNHTGHEHDRQRILSLCGGNIQCVRSLLSSRFGGF
ncbi:MAG: beta-1,3-glucanase family protein, partial [Limisphaerales bacterium]